MIISEILAVFWMTLVGYVIINRFRLLSGTYALAHLAYAFGLGSGLCGFQLYLYSRLHIPWYLLYLILPWVLLFLLFFLSWGKEIFLVKFVIPKLSIIDGVLLLSLVILIGFVGFEALIRPVSAWDSWAIWLLKAKIFFTDGYINPQRLVYVESGYPILLSLSAAYNYIFMGFANDQYVLLFFFAFYLFLGIAFYTSLRQQTGRTFALFMTCLLLSTQNIVRHGGRYEVGQADLAVGFYIFLCSILFYHYIAKSNIRTLILLNMLLGIVSLIKNEGLIFSLVIQALFVMNAIRNKQYRSLIFLFIWLIPVADWQIYKAYSHIPDISGVFIGSFTNFKRILPIFVETTKEFFNIKNWNLLWAYFYIVFIGSIIFRKQNALWVLYLIIFFQLGFYLCIYFVFPKEVTTEIHSSFDRLLIHVAPLALFISSIESFKLFNQEKITMATFLKRYKRG